MKNSADKLHLEIILLFR